MPFFGYAGTPLPTNPSVVQGQVSHQYFDNELQINQASDRAIVRYDTFDIQNNYGVLINQPSSSSTILARVASMNPSIIDGILQASGNVFIVNPNGIIFGANSRIDVNSIIASTLNITDSNFMNGNLEFEGDSVAAIQNQSNNFNAQNYVALISKEIKNQGSISANQVAIASASEVFLDHAFGGKINVDVSGLLGTFSNDGYLEAAGDNDSQIEGAVIARAGTISNSGTVLANDNGDINGGYIDFYGEDEIDVKEHSVLEAKGENSFVQISSGENGTTLVSGSISAKGNKLDEAGGTIHVLGDKIGILNNATIDVSGDAGGGEVLIGGDYQGNNPAIQNASRNLR